MASALQKSESTVATADLAHAVEAPIPLTGAGKAAVLILALGSKYGAEVWEALSDEEVRTISLAMSPLGTIDVEIVEKLMLQFTSQMTMAGALTGNYESTERLLSQFLPKERV